MKIINRYIFLGSLLFASAAKGHNYDSTYYQKYSDKLIISIYQSQRRFTIDLSQSLIPDAGKGLVKYNAEANRATGLNFLWDKIGFSFDYKTLIPDTKAVRQLGASKYFNLGFSFGANDVIIEPSIKQFNGFYDVLSPIYLPNYVDGNSTLYHDENLVSRVIKVKGLYFTNHEKFSFRAPYSHNFRQLKSAFSWVFMGNIYQNKISSVNGIIPPLLRGYFFGGNDLKRLTMVGFSNGLGLSGNLVILKGWFFNFSIWGGPDFHWRQSDFSTNKKNQLVMSGFLENRISLGFNLKSFYIYVTSLNEAASFSMKTLNMRHQSYSGYFTIGYRFRMRPNRVTKFIQENKYYKML